MIGNSSMPGEVNKALAIWRGRQCRAGPRKSWSKFAWSNSNYEDSGISWVVDVVGMHPKIFSGIMLGLDSSIKCFQAFLQSELKSGNLATRC